jgi:hypothetical protein
VGGAATVDVAGVPQEADLDRIVEEALHTCGKDDTGLKRRLLAKDPTITPTWRANYRRFAPVIYKG